MAEEDPDAAAEEEEEEEEEDVEPLPDPSHSAVFLSMNAGALVAMSVRK